MDKREQELRQKVADLKAKAEEFNNSGKYEDAKAKIEEAKNAKNELDNYLAMMQIQVSDPVNSQAGVLPPASVKNEDPSYKEVFMKAIRGQNLSHEEASVMQEYKAALSENSGKDGGYIVPEDITTTINQLKQTVDSLEQYVNVQPVSTNKGARTLEKRAASTPFAPLSEYGKPNAMQEIASPEFDRLSYAIEDYAGFLPVPNDLLDDTDQALESYLRQWIAKKSIATRNYLILQEINKLTKVDLKDYNGLKTTLNVTLDPIFAAAANIFTNQDGFNYLDQLEDKNGRPLLQPDPTNPTRKLFSGKPVIVLSNKTIATDKDGKAPFIVGDLKEAVILWDRKQLSIDMTKEGGNAWRTNTSEFRAIEREDVTLWDQEAVVYGQITIVPKTGA
ncbi:phage major capsid protein [Bacillus thuringiensis serovar kyushuensis]|uniref:phage major capsid protein n=1 Tax=Bacillus thuringiensis TaxID=1428 RepID=UPI000B42D768|nr:phage major capsid protein [Bacillus thuringiensis]MEC2866024.1 phage major capsid protein [Bacillus cereus]OTZ62138.1 phage major capsid protein [Bacillus thuringiensis serovar kyushuensis]OTZ62217.1 phage major capsid protein [Bacillus thuringiensis serovar kyushuensis]OTZ62342.1 phage major capsid protein [Bacillus thuringiensis serovar kyushuensis]OTZ62370.1 phage major capsid protein [Bacillus thuringiensis serovar kyushuensis]